MRNTYILLTISFLFFAFSYNNTAKESPIVTNLDTEIVPEQSEALGNCPPISSAHFSTLGPPDIPHKIRVVYDSTNVYPAVSWESNDSQTTILDYDGGNFGAYYHENGYSFVDIKFTRLVDGVNCTSTHILGWPQ
jgi:hypothetical protein